MITSSQNPKVQQVRSLLHKTRERRDTNLFIIEGVRLAEEAISSGWPVKQTFYSDSLSERGMHLIEQLSNSGSPVEQVSESVMQSLADTQTAPGILLILAMQILEIPTELDFLVIVDAVRDPGNLGTLLRTAAAAGAQAVLLTPTTVDAFSPKVLRAGMGAHFHVPLKILTWSEIASLLKHRPKPIHIFMAESGPGTPLWESDLRNPCALIIGNEADGPSQDAQSLADARLHIPMPGRSESLNAAAAAAIILFEVVRQRQVK
jgi:RNA methyltransferase, TrmH family